MTTDLASLLERPESETLDFKASSYDLSDKRKKRDFAKDLASLTNTPCEGDANIVLGVKKRLDGSFELLGLENEIDDSDLESVAFSLLEPSLRFLYQPIRHDGVLLGLITIPLGQQSPVTPKKTLGNGFLEGVIYFRRGSQNAAASVREQERIWDWFGGGISPTEFDAPLGPNASSPGNRLDADALLLGPVQAFGLESKVEEAHRLASSAPAAAAGLYAEVAKALRERFPGHADRYEQLLATALRGTGDPDGSHDLLMDLAIRDLFERAEPQLSSEVARGLKELHDEVDEVRRARGSALMLFGRCHESPAELEGLAACFDSLEPEDPYAPFIAALLAEAALADRAFELVLDRQTNLRMAGDHGDRRIELRVRAALGDAGVPSAWPDLIDRAEAFRFPAAEGTYVCLRGARWCAWNGQLNRAESLYRQAMKLGAEANLDLDVENGLWSLNVLYAVGYPSDQLLETNHLALSIEGSRSYVMRNPRTQQRSYQYIANERLPDAHLWARYRLLESIRSGCLMDELESHAILARIYSQSTEPHNALEHAVLGRSQKFVEELASQASEWPEFLASMAASKAPWVREAAVLALEHVGDLAPAEVARELVAVLLHSLSQDAHDIQVAPGLFKAFGAIVLEATDEDLRQLMPVLERLAAREPGTYRLSDPGVLTVVGRLYRFRPTLRQQAAAILREMAVSGKTGAWSRTINECGDETDELIEAVERVAERDTLDLADRLADLGHPTAATRALWSQRLQFVAEHPLGQRAEHIIGPRYDVPADFLREQDAAVVNRYVDKLVAIGSDHEERVINRAAALEAASDVMDMLPHDERRQLFGRVQPLAEQPTQISKMDHYDARSQHPLSRFRISFGREPDVRAAAGWFLGRAAADPDECSVVIRVALAWIRSGDPELERTGAWLLTLSDPSSSGVRSEELANHANPSVRQISLRMPDMLGSPNAATLEQLASDPDRGVRIRVVYALPSVQSTDSDAYERIRARLNADPSAIVRAYASTLQRPRNLLPV